MQVVNDHIAADICVRSPAQVLMAQEVDERFIETLRNPAGSDEAWSWPHPVNIQHTPMAVGSGDSADYEKRYTNMAPWHVVAGKEGDGSKASTLIIAARSSRAKSSTSVEWRKMYHREYKDEGNIKKGISRIVTAQVEWLRPMNGDAAEQFVNVHFHHSVAKQDFQ